MALIKLSLECDLWEKITHADDLPSFNGFSNELISWCEETGTKIKVGIRFKYEQSFETCAMKDGKPLYVYRDISDFKDTKFDDSIEWINIDFWFESEDAITLFKLAWT